MTIKHNSQCSIPATASHWPLIATSALDFLLYKVSIETPATSFTAMTTLLAIFLAFPSVHVAHSLALNSSSLHNGSFPSALLATASVDAADIIASCKDLDSCRSLYSIIQTCVATIFACVWVAVHRNIPAPQKKPNWSSNAALKAAQWVWSKIADQKQSFVVFTVTLLAPEWVLAWAIRQALRARNLKEDLERARERAEKKWKEVDGDAVEANMAVMGEDEPSRSDGSSLRSSSDDNVTLIEKQSNKGSFHPLDLENQMECTQIF